MATYDLIIRNGTIVDGTGAPRFTGDLAVKDGLIAAVGAVHGDAAQEIDAVPDDPYDERLDFVVTERETFMVRAA